jgi:Guanosine polyphosphate pyrophosphohydrolases/synthetases
MLNKAIEIAAKAHSGQVDKGGNPYIMHPLRVMLNFCESEPEPVKICAVLHDVVEDSNITLDDLRAEGFSDEVIAALGCLTKKPGENYDDFISRVLTNDIACKVKNGDIADNMDLTRIPNPMAEDEERIQKYRKASDRIADVLPYADSIPDCRLIEVNGIAEIHPAISLDQFSDMFIRFIESHGWFFGGGYKDVTDEESNDVLEENDNL